METLNFQCKFLNFPVLLMRWKIVRMGFPFDSSVTGALITLDKSSAVMLYILNGFLQGLMRTPKFKDT